MKALDALKRGEARWDIFDRVEGGPLDLRGVDLRGAKLSKLEFVHIDLTDSDLSNAAFSDCSFNNVTLRGASLRGADLSRAFLESVDLSGANLSSCQLWGARLTGVNLSGADLRDACLEWATFSGCEASGAQFTGAELSETVFGDIDLTDASGLDECSFFGPSFVGHGTMERTRRLPLNFLRGCGLPDVLIQYLPSLTQASPVQFFSCFISYTTASQGFADRLHADLQNNGVRCWFAPHDMEPGKKIYDQIDEAIRIYDRLLLILSNESMASPWVKTEIAKARKKEQKQGRRVLFPVTLVPFDDVRKWKQFDGDIGDDSAKEIREYFIPDFSTWKTDHDAYAKAFDKLLRALKNADAKPAEPI